DITFAGKKRITLIGGGSYLRLEAGKIEYGTTATYLRRTKRTMAAGAALVPVKSMTGGGICLSCLMKAAMNGDTFVVRGES
ncbi:type VI secretion system tip protein VgrG, partial [Enterobacter mori]